MPKLTSAAESSPRTPVVRMVLVTLDHHLGGALERSRTALAANGGGVEITTHAASDWSADPGSLERCLADIGQANIIIATMLFMEEHIQPVLAAIKARRADCDALVACMCAGEVVKLTRMGRLSMDAGASGPLALLRRLRGGRREGDAAGKPSSSGAAQMKMLRRLPQILRFIPGTAQDLRAYFLVLQYWLAGSEENLTNLMRMLVHRYADGPRKAWRSRINYELPVEYPEVGLYHPRLAKSKSNLRNVGSSLAQLPKARQSLGRVGMLVMRSYILAGNTAHYDQVIASLEARGLEVVPAFASGLDARPAIEQFFVVNGKPTIDALLSLTGFSLVGGPAYNDAQAAAATLALLDVPYLAAQPLEFQTLEQWQASARGLLPVEATMMVAIPELDGATGAMVFAGRGARTTAASKAAGQPGALHEMHPQVERINMLSARIARLVALKKSTRAQRKVALVLFNFPPNSGNSGTAMHLSVFASAYRTLVAMRDQGYQVELPASIDALREAVIHGNAERFGATANVAARVSVNDHVRRETWLAEIEAQWGPAPGIHQADGASIFVLGARFGNVFVGVQPGFGYEGDPMRLLFEQGFAPTHAFSAFYRWIREDFGADAVLHFGTHGALEFMPGKQAGLSAACWPDRLIGDLPNLYLYASNNPSEGTIAKRRAAATLVSYLTPPIARAGLYRGLVDLKASLERWRALPPATASTSERADLAALIVHQATELELTTQDQAWTENSASAIEALRCQVLELEQTLIPHGLHVVGEPLAAEARTDLLHALAESTPGEASTLTRDLIARLVAGGAPAALGKDANERAALAKLAGHDALLKKDHELPALLHALDGGFVAPAPGGDLLRTPEVLPTGRNLHGFDPFRIPSAYAVIDGAKQAARLLARHLDDGHRFPETIALVLWGTDNLKSEGAPIAQALALLGAKPRFDAYGRLAGAELLPPSELGRPRVDVVMTLSGIFRDLLPLQTRLLAEAAFLAASADEPLELNFVRKHALAYQAAHGGDLETAALRVFSNADGTYGANVNHLVHSSTWDDEDELAETFARRKCFAYGRAGVPMAQPKLLNSVLTGVELAFQNLDSVEIGVTTVDIYFDTLGGITRAAKRAKACDQAHQDDVLAVYIGDQTRGEGTVRTLAEQVALETRTRTLNPKWYEGMLEHGYEGVRQIELAVANTMGWSATTGQVAPWVYQRLSETYVLDAAMRERMAQLNPHASAKVASRLLEAQQRNFWSPDAATLDALQRAGEELEDRVEGVFEKAAA